MELRTTRRIPRMASALAVVAGIANVVSQALASTELSGPTAVSVIAGALAPTLAILVAWWVPSRMLGVAILSVAMLLELPAPVAAGSAFALAVACLLVLAVMATYHDRPGRPRQHGE